MIAAAVDAGALDGDDVERLFDDADGVGGAVGVGADGAGVGVGDVLADAAELGAVLDLEERVGERFGFGARGAEDVVGEALGALGADAGQAVEGVDQPGEGGSGDGRSLHRAAPTGGPGPAGPG